MSNPYNKEQWKKFRDEVIELDDDACIECKRGPKDGVVLQVHHKIYIPRKLPWEYRYEDCETLCKACHSAKHGLTFPKFGWSHIGDEDLEELSGHCECCGAEIRYVFYIHHPNWEPMGVGTICCDNLTGTEIASNHMESVLRFRSRRTRFVTSSRWEDFGYFWSIRQKGITLRVIGPP